MARGHSHTSMFLLLIIAAVIIIGLVVFGASMQSVYAETNYTAENQTITPYEISYGWWFGAVILLIVLAIGTMLWSFRR